MYTAELIFEFESEKEAKIISRSIYPEIKHKIPKTKTRLSLLKDKIFLTIQADNISSLRAACNSYIRWIKTAVDVKEKMSAKKIQ
jgi:tRNA threonylcarbamoyladenosine modification (KEOPS) complex  Pcc1 subunit